MSDTLRFRFEGSDQSGETAKGTVRATTEGEAFAKLKRKGFVVSSLNVLKETGAVEVATQSEIRFRYSGTDEDGEESSGTIKAESREKASQILNERRIVATRLETDWQQKTVKPASNEVRTNAISDPKNIACVILAAAGVILIVICINMNSTATRSEVENQEALDALDAAWDAAWGYRGKRTRASKKDRTTAYIIGCIGGACLISSLVVFGIGSKATTTPIRLTGDRSES